MRLNGFDDAHMRGLLDYYTESLRKSEEMLRREGGDPERRDTLLEFVRQESEAAGLLSYGLSESAEAVRRHFVRSAQACKEMFRGGAAGRWKNPVTLLEGVYLSLIVGGREDARELAEVGRYGPGHYDDGAFAADEAVMGYVSAFLAYARGEREPALEGAKANAERCRGRKEGYAQVFGWHSTALGAVLEGDEGAFEESLTKIVRRHAQEAQRGRLRNDVRGLMCVSASALARAGADEGVRAKVESPYVPDSLLTD